MFSKTFIEEELINARSGYTNMGSHDWDFQTNNPDFLMKQAASIETHGGASAFMQCSQFFTGACAETIMIEEAELDPELTLSQLLAKTSISSTESEEIPHNRS